MKILFFTRLFYPHVGGVEKHVMELTKQLIKKGHEVTVLTTQYDENLQKNEKVQQINIIRFNQSDIKYLGIIHTWYWIIKNISLIKESDIVHVHDVFIWYWPIKLLLPNKKVFTTFHGRWGKYPIDFMDVLQKRIGTKLSDGVICIGDYITKNYGIKADVVTYGAVATPKASFRKDDNLIVYVGRLDRELALNTIFGALKKIKGYKIVFCGNGELSYEANIYGEVKGFIDPTPFYKKAKFIFASGYLTILEALSYRCLVFTAYNNPLHKDYYALAPFKNHIVSSSSSEVLSEKLKFFSANRKTAQKIAIDGYNWVKSETWEKLAEKYLKLWSREKT